MTTRDLDGNAKEARAEPDEPYPRVEPNPLAGMKCKYCQSPDIWVELRPSLTITGPIEENSRGQQQAPAAQIDWPWAVCGGCKHESKGKF